MRRFPLALVAAALLGAFTAASRAQQEDPVPSSCIAMAQSLPNVVYANFTPQLAQADFEKGEVTITYVGHSTYLIDTPGGVRVATDFSGRYPVDPMPRVVTMNKAHSGHFTRAPDPSIEYPLNGWAEGG